MKEGIFGKVSFQTNLKSVSHEILEVHGQPKIFIIWTQPFFSSTLLKSGLCGVNYPVEGESLHVNTARLIGEVKHLLVSSDFYL